MEVDEALGGVVVEPQSRRRCPDTQIRRLRCHQETSQRPRHVRVPLVPFALSVSVALVGFTLSRSLANSHPAYV